MANQPARHRSSRLRALRWSGIVFAAAIALTIVLYALTPFLVARLAPHFATRLGLDSLELDIGYPGVRGVDISGVTLASDELLLKGSDARVDYSWRALLEGRIDRLAFAELEVSFTPAAGDAARPGAGDKAAPEVPFRLSAERLIVKVPHAGFVGIGRAEMGGGRLSLSMDGIEPQVASRFFVTAEVSLDGDFSARFGERDSGGAEFVALRGSLGDEAVDIAGSVSLDGYPLELASELAGLPPGTGTIAGEFETRLPWPLPDPFSWREITVTLPAYSVDWRSDKNGLELNAISGSAVLRHGDVDAVAAGDLRYRRDEREIAARLPAGYELRYRQGILTGGAGPSLRLRQTGADASATLHSFSAGLAPVMQLAADADIDAAIDNVRATGRLTAALIGDALSVEGRLDLRSHVQSPPGSGLYLPAGAGSVAARIETQLPSPLPDELAWQELVATIPSLAVDWKSAKKDLDLDAVSGSLRLDRGDVSGTLSGVVRSRLGGRELSARLPKRYRIDYRKGTLTAGPGLRLRLQAADTDATATLRGLALRTTPTTRLDIDADIVGRLDTTSAAGRLTGRVTIADAKVPKMNGRLDYSGSLETPGQRRDAVLDSTFTLSGNALAARGTLSSGPSDKVPFTLSHDLGSGAGRLRANHSFRIRQGLAASLIPQWKEVYDLDAGQLEAELSVDWREPDPLAAGLVLNLAGGRAHYEDYLASGISGRLDFRSAGGVGAENWRLEPALLEIKRVDAGIPIENLVLGLSWSGDRVEFSEARATLLGGKAAAPPFAYDIAAGSAVFDLALRDIELAAVLAVEGDDVTGTGTLDGMLPVVVTDNQPRIDGGVVTANPPGGVIRLSPTLAGSGGRPELTFALLALTDFRYNELIAHIDYAENGDLALGVRLKGRNPAVEKGRPIHYNLNIAENVPALLESLQLKDKVTERVEKEVKK